VTTNETTLGPRWAFATGRARRAVLRLSEEQRAVLVRRLTGEAFGAIAAGAGTSRQRVKQVEQEALDTLARAAGKRRAGVTVAGVLSSGRAAYALAGATEGQVTEGLPLGGMGQVRGTNRVRGWTRERVERRLDDLATAMLAEAEAGGLTPERRRHYERAAARIAGA
jgi:hypothetical protein